MTTKNIVPRENGEGSIGTTEKKWDNVYARKINDSCASLYWVNPSNDTSGVTDSANIQKAIDLYNVVFLEKGTYYIATPIIVRDRTYIAGCGKDNTTIICKQNGVDKNGTTSSAYITIKDISFVKESTDTNLIGLNLAGLGVSPYRGTYYSIIDNVRVTGFNIGIYLKGCWSNTVNQLKTDGCQYSVKMDGTCNNITFNDCQFLGDDTSRAIFMSSAGGSENYGIVFNNCDIERQTVACEVYACVGLTFNNLYCEGVNTVFKLTAVCSFLAKGGMVVGGRFLAEVSRSGYTSALFNKNQATFEDILFCKTDNEDTYLICQTSNVYVTVKNVKVYNQGTGKTYTNNIIMGTLGINSHHTNCLKHIVSTDTLSVKNSNYSKFHNPYPRDNDDGIRCVAAKIVILSNLNITSGGQVIIQVTNLAGNGLFVAYLKHSLTAGSVIDMQPINSAADKYLTDVDWNNICIYKTEQSGGASADANYRVDLYLESGEVMVIQ